MPAEFDTVSYTYKMRKIFKMVKNRLYELCRGTLVVEANAPVWRNFESSLQRMESISDGNKHIYTMIFGKYIKISYLTVFVLENVLPIYKLVEL